MPRKKQERIYIWVTEKEKAELQELAKKAETSLGQFLLIAAKNSTFLKVEGLKDVAHELRKIGNNLNQLTHLAHIINLKSRSNNPPKKIPDFNEKLDETKKGFDRIWRSLNSLIEKTQHSKV
jgi:ubiquinone biosynthesis protein UbiJ